uniref:Uncharacterized protein n=1 Tax=Solanum lycopersicum TaxID=4081 RepID=A0A3Q7FL91_SOLLC
MFFDTPRTWILYEPMDRDKSLLLSMTSSLITSFFPYPYPLFSVTHQMKESMENHNLDLEVPKTTEGDFPTKDEKCRTWENAGGRH